MVSGFRFQIPGLGPGYFNMESGTLNLESEILRNLKLKSFSHVSAIVNPLFSIVSKKV